MNMFKKNLLVVAATLVAGNSFAAASDVAITEWMYKGGVGEFIEFTNIGTTAIDFTGWSYDDDSRKAGTFSLSGFGIVAAGASVIITETWDNVFRDDWGLDASVKVLGNYSNNIGNGDEINIYDASGSLVDRLTYGSNPRTDGTSGRATSADALGANDVSKWVFSTVGDVEGSWRAASGTVGSPGQTSFVSSVPEPESYALMLGGLALVGAIARRRVAR